MENLKDNLAYEQTFSLHFIYWKLTQNDEEECVVRERERQRIITKRERENMLLWVSQALSSGRSYKLHTNPTRTS